MWHMNPPLFFAELHKKRIGVCEVNDQAAYKTL